MSKLYDVIFDQCKTWVKKKRSKGVSWEELKYACKNNEEGLNDFLEARKEDDDWPEELDTILWKELIDELEDAEKKKIALGGKTAIIVSNPKEITKVTVPEEERTSWQLYKKHLKSGDFSEEAIENIEESCVKILKQLSKDTVESGPIKGLVVGNVQSGKTANMAGLMAMAADWGWNMFIVLSGTIENLRKQTQNRLYGDLNHAGNLVWTQFDHLSKKKSPIGQRLCDLQLQPDSPMRYMTVCLKLKSRLNDLIDWIEADTQNIQNLKVLVIDDEADQAGINTGDVYSDDDRKTINRLILNLVHCRDKNAENDKTNTYKSHYQAMNYISYTATPYSNCLNEMGDQTLYPKNFIHTLSVSRSYFGPQRIFGLPDADNEERLNIVNIVPEKDVDTIIDTQKNDTGIIPQSLKEAICWFIISAAIMRYYGYKKPVSMLIHTSQKQDHHENVSNAVQAWIEKSKSKIVDLCENVYVEQKQKLTISLLRRAYPEYEHPDNEIWEYPPYEILIPYIEELVGEISPIRMDEEGELKYIKGIHICIDNCGKNGVDEDGMHMRLAYPDKNSANAPDYSTAFIIVGGNTLSRGLTLEGLVSTFFLRSVKQADTLMQMGRWFGYRKHYELLPRIWMTTDCVDKFEYLTDVDSDLRDQIYQMMVAGMSPADFNLALLMSPKVSWMALTSKNKMQMAEAAGVDFSGMDTQLTVYTRDTSVLKNNIDVANRFLALIGSPRKSENAEAFVWENIQFTEIKKNLFDAGFKVAETSKAFQQIDLLEEWIEAQTEKGEMTTWNVLMCGVNADKLDESKKWTLDSGISVGKINRSCKSDSGDHFNIGVLSGKKDYVADITEDMIGAENWKKMRTTKKMSTEYKDYRNLAHVEKIPLLLLYMIDKNSQPQPGKNRTPLNVEEDLIGITMVIPGIRGKHGAVTKVKIKQMNDDQEGEDNNAN